MIAFSVYEDYENVRSRYYNLLIDDKGRMFLENEAGNAIQLADDELFQVFHDYFKTHGSV